MGRGRGFIATGPPITCPGCRCMFTPSTVHSVEKRRRPQLCPTCVKRKKKAKGIQP